MAKIHWIIVPIMVASIAMMIISSADGGKLHQSWCKRLEEPKKDTRGWCVCGHADYPCRCNPKCTAYNSSAACEDDEKMLCSTSVKSATVCICQKEMVTSLDKYMVELRKLTEYDDVFNIHQLAKRARDFQMTQDNQVQIDDSNRALVDDFKREVTKPTGGLRHKIDLLLQLLIGKPWEGVRSTIGKGLYSTGILKELCKEGVNGGLIAFAAQSVQLYDFGVNLKTSNDSYPSDENWRNNLAAGFAKAEGVFHEGCKCPNGTKTAKYYKVSKLLPNLGMPTQTSEEAKDILLKWEIEDSVPKKERLKAYILIRQHLFDMTDENLKIIKKYTYEGIDLVRSFIQQKRMTGNANDKRLELLPGFEDLTICANKRLNS